MDLLLPISFVAVMWWLSTGAVLWLATRTNRAGLRMAMMVATGALGLVGAAISAQDMSAPYLAFVSALAVWALVEYLFLTGHVTGPIASPCPDGLPEADRFRRAFSAISHHEYALLAAMAAIAVVSLQGGQFMALATFGLLWLLRISAKLTLFSGAPKFALDMMPPKIAYMQSYFRHDRIGPVFWLSVILFTAAFIAAILLLTYGKVAQPYMVHAAMLTTLLGLGVLEHWFMILPITDSALWRWAMPEKRREKRKSATHHKGDTAQLLITPGYNTARHKCPIQEKGATP